MLEHLIQMILIQIRSFGPNDRYSRQLTDAAPPFRQLHDRRPFFDQPIAQRSPRIPQSRRHTTSEEAEEVAAPGDTRLGNERVRHRAAVEDGHDQSNDGGGDLAVERRAKDEISEQAEHEAARPDMLGVAFAEEPRAESADQHAAQGDEQELKDTAEEDDGSQDQQRNAVGDQMPPGGVDERGNRNPIESAPRPWDDARSSRRPASWEKCIDGVDEPHDPHTACEHRGSEWNALVLGEHV